MSDEEENNEEEEDEDEEKEDGEDEEKEDEEEEEKEDEDNNKVKEKKTDTESTSKFGTEKLVSNEIKLDLANGIQNSSPLTLSDIPVEQPKSILSILAEINSDMDTLSSELTQQSFSDSKRNR